jgi:hypothetical protein
MPTAPFHAKIADMPRESIADGVLTRTAVRTDDASHQNGKEGNGS